MSEFSARILDDILNGKNVVMSSKMSLVSDDTEDDELLDEIDEDVEEEVEDVEVESEDKEVLDELDSVEEDEAEDIEELDEEVVKDVASPVEELKAFAKLEETIDDFIINSDIDFSAHPKLKDFALKYTEELETAIDELRQEKNDALFDEGVTASKRDSVGIRKVQKPTLVFAFETQKGWFCTNRKLDETMSVKKALQFVNSQIENRIANYNPQILETQAKKGKKFNSLSDIYKANSNPENIIFVYDRGIKSFVIPEDIDRIVKLDEGVTASKRKSIIKADSANLDSDTIKNIKTGLKSFIDGKIQENIFFEELKNVNDGEAEFDPEEIAKEFATFEAKKEDLKKALEDDEKFNPSDAMSLVIRTATEWLRLMDEAKKKIDRFIDSNANGTLASKRIDHIAVSNTCINSKKAVKASTSSDSKTVNIISSYKV